MRKGESDLIIFAHGLIVYVEKNKHSTEKRWRSQVIPARSKTQGPAQITPFLLQNLLLQNRKCVIQ